MAKKGSFSKVYDKNGDYVDVEAARFDGTRTFQMQGDVTASQTWNGDPSSPLTLNASIGAKKVTTDKINDKAVQAQQIDDGAVGLTQIATTAMNGTVQDNDSKLATHAAVKTYVDSQISGQGTYLGKHTVAEINAMVTDGLHNGDRVMTSDSGTINLGPGGLGFDVEAGEDLILYKSGSTVQWDSMDGNFKTKQSAVVDPTASGSTLEFIDSITQDENGEITASKKAVQDGTTSQKGVVQLAGSIGATVASENNKAASEKAVRDAINAMNAETTANKVTSVRNVTTATDTAYPSELAVIKAINAVKTSGLSNGHTGGTIFLTVNCSSQDFYNTEIEISIAEASGGKGFTFVSAPRYVGSSFSGLLKVVNGQSAFAPIRCLNWTDENGKRYFGFAVTINGSFRFSFSAIGPESRVGLISVSDVALSSVTEISRLTVRNCVSAENNTAVGSTSVPTYVDVNGSVQACTDDFVHDADLGKFVAIADSTIARRGNTGDGWYKVAESDLTTGANTKRSSCWRLIVSNTPDNKTPKLGNLLVSVQAGSNTGDALNVRQAVLFADDWNTTYNPVKLVVRGTTENATIELWVKVGVQYSGMNISELLGTGYYGIDSKIRWTYTSYDNNGGSAAPVTDAPNNVTVTDVDVVIRQHAIASPTNNNLVAMDASGLVKDSGKKATDFVQSVKIGSGSELKDASGNVVLPVDSAPTANSTNLVTSGGVRSELDRKPFIYVARRNTDADDAFDSNEGNRFRVVEYTNASSNLPTSAFYHIYSSVGPDRSYQVQLALGMTSQDCYFRRKRIVDDVSTWSEWKKFIFEGDLTSALNNKQDLLPTSGTASDSYAINITGNAATATKPQAVELTSSDDLNDKLGTNKGDVLTYVWSSSSVPANAPRTGSGGVLIVINKANSNYTKQICFSSAANYIYVRGKYNGSWDSWARVVETRDIVSTYSSSGTDPVNGTAVAAALATLDVADTAVSHQFVTVVSETDGKVSIIRAQPVISDVDGLQTALDGKEGSITWMTEQEARSIWANAKAAVAAS